MEPTQINVKQLANGITRSIIKGAFQNKELVLIDTPIQLSIDHTDEKSTITITGKSDKPNSEIFFLDINRNDYKAIDTKNREQLQPAILTIYNDIKALEYLTPDTVNEPYHRRLNISDHDVIEFINETVNNSHNYIDYQNKQKYLTKSLSNFDDGQNIVHLFLRSVITKPLLDDFLFKKNIDDKALTNIGLRPLTETPFFFDQFKNQMIEFFFDKKNPFFKDVFQNLIDKAEDELVDTVFYTYNETPEPKNKELEGIAAKLALLKKTQAMRAG